jgi:hypothetical protein
MRYSPLDGATSRKTAALFKESSVQPNQWRQKVEDFPLRPFKQTQAGKIEYKVI